MPVTCAFEGALITLLLFPTCILAFIVYKYTYDASTPIGEGYLLVNYVNAIDGDGLIFLQQIEKVASMYML
jgi:hypothetical protein